MKMLKTLLNSPFVFWALLALPSIGMINSALSGQDLEPLLHPSGEFAARFMILAMMLTPLRMLFPKSGLVLWFLRRRRFLGVAAFGYAALHTLYYVIDLGSLSAVGADLDGVGGIRHFRAVGDDLQQCFGPPPWPLLEGAAALCLCGGSRDPAALDFCPL